MKYYNWTWHQEVMDYTENWQIFYISTDTLVDYYLFGDGRLIECDYKVKTEAIGSFTLLDL